MSDAEELGWQQSEQERAEYEAYLAESYREAAERASYDAWLEQQAEREHLDWVASHLPDEAAWQLWHETEGSEGCPHEWGEAEGPLEDERGIRFERRCRRCEAVQGQWAARYEQPYDR